MKTSDQRGTTFHFLIFIGLLALILGIMFWKSFVPGYVHFSNDGPLGIQKADFLNPSSGITGVWNDLNSIGASGGTFTANITTALKLIQGPVGYSKFLAPISLLILGIGAWVLLWQLRFAPVVCTIGAIAAALNSTYFSAACWGVASQEIAMGMNFLAIALVVSSGRATTLGARFSRLALAGAAVGLSIMEGLDNGALFSLFIAAYTLFQALSKEQGPVLKRALSGILQTAVIALCAGLIAAQTLAALITTQIQGVAGTDQDSQTKEERWDWATQWSLPKREVISLVVPGVFGYRMDTPEGGNYWGAIGRDPAWDRYFAGNKEGPEPQGFMRFSGGGIYLGVPVALIAIWTAWQAFRRKNSVFVEGDRRLLWFWIAAAGVALLLALGRFAPFYQVFYSLPYFSTIRNPVKFVAVFNFAVLILFAYGLQALWGQYLRPAHASPVKSSAEKGWMRACGVAIVISVVAWGIYGMSRESLVQYLQTVQFDGTMAEAIARFSLRQLGWFVILLAASITWMILVLKGRFAGSRALTAGLLLGLLVAVDLGRANSPWTVFVDYSQKYESNPVIDRLKEKPYERRVAILPFRSPPQFALFEQLYRIEWAQHHFPYFNIHSLDIVQMPRVPADLQAFESALHFNGTPESLYLVRRRWALTSTRYLLGPAGFLDVLNQQIDPELKRFRMVQAFNVVPKVGISQPTRLEELTAVPAAEGQYALFEFTGALPKAKLYSNWQIPVIGSSGTNADSRLAPANLQETERTRTNDLLTLEKLASPGFDPHEIVLLADIPEVPSPADTNRAAGTVEFQSYRPTDIVLKARSESPAVLLLNDRYDPNWKVFVDGKEAPLLRANFIMRGVYLPAGEHEVRFRFRIDTRPMYVTIAALSGAILLACYVGISSRRGGGTPSNGESQK